MGKTYKIDDISNVGGSLEFFEKNSKYYWGIMNYDGTNYREIPKSLYDELKKYLIITILKSRNDTYDLDIGELKNEYISELKNNYGSLEIFEKNGEYYWGITCVESDIIYYKITKSLYDELKNHQNLKIKEFEEILEKINWYNRCYI